MSLFSVLIYKTCVCHFLVIQYIKLVIPKNSYLRLLLIYKEKRIIEDMKQAICLIPAQCAKCGELFDLSYDLEMAGWNMDREIVVAEVIRKMSRNKVMTRESLCWNCRETLQF